MISEVSTTQTPKDMVFSQKSVNTHSILKVVELNRLKPEKVSGINGVIAGGHTKSSEPQLVATTSFSEDYLKPEPQFESTMFNEPDCEFFQDLVQWCSDPAKEEPLLIDSLKPNEASFHNTDTIHTSFSPQGWDALELDANSPAQTGYQTSTPNDPLSPNADGFTAFDNKFLYNTEMEIEGKASQEQLWDITNLPVVLGDLASEKMVDLNPYSATGTVSYNNNTHVSYDTEYTLTSNTHKTLLIDDEDSLDMKLNPVIPREVENNNVVISEYIINNPKGGVLERSRAERRGAGLSLDVNTATPWSAGAISTPEVLSYVEQLEKEKCTLPILKTTQHWPVQDSGFESTDNVNTTATSPPDFKPISPKFESHLESDTEDVKSVYNKRKRHNSEDSDETYTPYAEYTPRKYKRRKPSIPIKDMILALEQSQQQPKARRGRPPKRRESTVSSVCSIDDNTSTTSTHEITYRIIRDKNNEASKRSRMNRKLKELQMEQLAVELEERNKRLQVKADILEDMTKRLKEALMTAILQKSK